MAKIVSTIIFCIVFLVAQDEVNYFELAKTNFNENNLVFALEQINLALQSDSTDAEICAFAYEIAFKLDDLDQAYQFIRKAIDLDKANEEYRNKWKSLDEIRSKLNEAQKSFESGYSDEAISIYGKSIINHPTFALFYYNLGMIYYKQDDFDNAVYNFKEARSINPYVDKYDSAILMIAQKLTQTGIEQDRRKDYDLAIVNYKKSIEYYPNYTEAIFRLGLVLYKVGDFESAKSTLQSLLDIDTTHIQALKLLGDTYSKLGDKNGAIEWYRKAVEINPNYDKAHYSLGRTLMSVGDNEGAIQSLNKAVEVNPTYSKAYETLGAIYQSTEQVDLAIQNYELSIANLDPRKKSGYVVYYRLALAYNEKQEYEKAKEAAKSSINIKRNYAAANFELGIAEMYLCNEVASKDAFEKAKKDRNYRKSVESYLKNYKYYSKDCN
ncbi:MAG: tetratricopeptide repeat protein [Candidatus Marinimicrobia bacterium]|nr:tetratricopeptide repeat protein [Candidatus Neomarinimicrobiota bacterium]MBL7023213.1 tetratricopeptide repeat protein [Candidatus Neomarinimicrobiota bacterium]MBL7109986.1 tetratricopeptide repeat protein [Candidatus Neomarinimicrobiota bacterium]